MKSPRFGVSKPKPSPSQPSSPHPAQQHHTPSQTQSNGEIGVGGDSEGEWDFESMRKSFENLTQFKEMTQKEVSILQYLHQTKGTTLRRHKAAEPAAPPLVDLFGEIDTELQKIREDKEQRKDFSESEDVRSDEEDPIINEDTEDVTEDSEVEDGEKELSEEEKERQKNLRAKLASMKWGDSDSDTDEGEGEEDTDMTETEGEEEAKDENDIATLESKPESNGTATNGESEIEKPVPSTPVDNTPQHEEKEQEKEQQQPASAPSTPSSTKTTTPATPTLTTTPTSPRDSTDKLPTQSRPLTDSAPTKTHLHPNPSKKWKRKQMKKLKRVSAELPSSAGDNNGGTTSHTNPLITKQGLKVKGGSLRGSKPKTPPRKETKTLNPLTVPKLRIDSSDELLVPSSPKSFRSPRYTPAIELFASSAKKAVKLLVDEKLVEDNPREIARFIFKCDQLDRGQIGDYISELGNELILKEFCKLTDFRNLDFDLALRRFLYRFRLPGEAQKIDRLMNAFAREYHKHNQRSPDNIFMNADSVYVLAFSVIMLNTDAHNPQIKKKMSLKEFIQNNKGINNGQDFPPSYLEDLYNRIIHDEIRLGTDTKLLYPNAVRKGWLYMKPYGGNTVSPRRLRSPREKERVWTRYWMLLSSDTHKDDLYYFNDIKIGNPVGSILAIYYKHTALNPKEAEKVLEESAKDKNKKALAGLSFFQLKARDGTHGYLFGAASEVERDCWMAVLSRRKRAMEHKQQKLASANGADPLYG